MFMNKSVHGMLYSKYNPAFKKFEILGINELCVYHTVLKKEVTERCDFILMRLIQTNPTGMTGSMSEHRLWSSLQQTRKPGQRQNCKNRFKPDQ